MADDSRVECNLDCGADCAMADFPIYLRPYHCRYVTDEDRRIRDVVVGGIRVKE
jgi:hypothetical protein